MGYGMNTDMPIRILGEHLVQRCRKIWWTVYILDRQMTSLMGNPSSISDDDVYCQLPTFAGSVQRTAALGMQVKLARVIAHINGSKSNSTVTTREAALIRCSRLWLEWKVTEEIPDKHQGCPRGNRQTCRRAPTNLSAPLRRIVWWSIENVCTFAYLIPSGTSFPSRDPLVYVANLLFGSVHRAGHEADAILLSQHAIRSTLQHASVIPSTPKQDP